MASHPAHVPSPCIQVCRIDPGSGLCMGCLRSLDEIAGWSSMNAREKGAVLSALTGRRERLAQPV